MAEEQKGKSVVKYTEWKIEKNAAGRLVCAKYETVTTDGVEAPAGKVREVAVARPDLTGTDVEAIVRACNRFGFNVADLVDQCRESDYQRNARNLRADLIEQDKKEGV